MATNQQSPNLRQVSDRLCSALAVNCLQLSCCLPQNAFVLDVSAAFPAGSADWMGELCKIDPTVKIRDLVVPGTHDSASYTIPGFKPFSAVARTQNLSVTQQLQCGARYLDIRFAGSSRDATRFSIWHGFLEGGGARDILVEIAEFLDDHPGEFLVLELVPEYGRSLTAEQKDAFLPVVQEIFGEKIFPGKDMKDIQERLTLAEVISDKKHQVAVLLHSRFWENYTSKSEEDIVNEYGFVKSQRWMRCKWHNTRVNDQLLEWNLEECETCTRDHQHHRVWLNNQFVLTPGVGGANDVLAALTGKNSLQPTAMVSDLYKPRVLDNYLRQHADKRWNLLMLDCIDKCPLVVQFGIALNFPTPIEVKLAAVCGRGSVGGDSSGAAAKDVTELASACVCRQRVLLLTHLPTDLQLPYEEGTITIAYKLGPSFEVLTLDFNAKTQLIVSKFACRSSAGGLDKVSLANDGDPSEGYVVRGQVHPDPPRTRDEGPALQFKRRQGDKPGFEFNIAG